MTNDIDYKNIKVVFVDWHKTLCSLPLFHELQEQDEALFDKFDKRLFDDMPITLFIEWMRGKFTRNDMVNLLAGEDLDVDFVREKLKSSCESMYFDRDEFIPLIERIRKTGRKVVIATDNIDTFCDYTVPALHLRDYFDDIISSFDVKCLKKDVKNGKMVFFDDYLSKNGIKYSEAVLLDDSFDTIEACRKNGIQVKCIGCPEDVIKTLEAIADARN